MVAIEELPMSTASSSAATMVRVFATISAAFLRREVPISASAIARADA
jgi:hypothetical protein